MTLLATFHMYNLYIDEGHIIVYKIKSHIDKTIEYYKAQWVAKGYSQYYNIDYDKTFVLIVRLKNLYMLLAYIIL